MLVNESCTISTSKVLLVPYEQHHVPTYHEWMKDPDLQEATASEPLTLPEEYSMQHSWRLDHDKLTFIICHPLTATEPRHVEFTVDDGSGTMIGDINLFLYPHEDEWNGKEMRSGCVYVVGEIELMIARKDMQRRGYGRASLLAFLWYILQSWRKISHEYLTGASPESTDDSADKSTDESTNKQTVELLYFRVRIGKDNDRSIRLFASLGFEQTEEGANYFGEVEMRWKPKIEILEQQNGWSTPRLLPYYTMPENL